MNNLHSFGHCKENAAKIVALSTGEMTLPLEPEETPEKNYAREFARKGGLAGGMARVEKLSAWKRKEIARKAAPARWKKK